MAEVTSATPVTAEKGMFLCWRRRMERELSEEMHRSGSE